MVKISNRIVLCLGILLVVFNIRYVEDFENELDRQSYRGKEGKTQFTTNAKLIGAKKAAADMLWINQVLSIGEQVGSYDNVEEIKDVPTMLKHNSEEISYLDPYFAVNYYFSSSIVALIRIYNRHDYGIEILKRGLLYNPEDEYMKMYMAGIIGDYKGDDKAKLDAFEGIVKNGVKDDMITNTLAFMYEKKYIHEGKKEYIDKAGKYWTMLLDSKDDKYKKIAVNKLKKYFNLDL